MKLTFYLQYFSYNDENFEVSDNYFQDSNDYIRQLEESYNQTKDAIFEAMSSGNYMNKANTYKMPIKATTSPKKEQISYCKCDGLLINPSNQEETQKTITEYVLSQEIVVDFLKLDFNTADEEFISNWYQFMDASEKIMKCDADEDWKFIRKPSRDIYFSYDTPNGNKCYGKLVGCRLEESKNVYENLLIIEKLVFLKELE